MVRSWKAFGLAVAAVLGAVLVLSSPGSPAIRPAFAADEITVLLDTDTPSGGTGVTFSVTGCTQTSMTLNDGQTTDLDCADGTIVITLTSSAWVLDVDDTVCTMSSAGTTPGQQSTVSENAAEGKITIGLTDDEAFSCVIDVNGSGTPSPTATTTPGTATPTATGTVTVAQLTVSIAPSTLSCSGSAFVTVVARNAAGQVVAAGPVTLATNLGTISPTSATDQGAGVLAVLTAPAAQGGTATVSVSAGGQTGSATATINCAQATAVPPTAVPPTQQPATGIIPPSTGEAGLAAGNSWGSAVAFGLLGLAFSAALAVAWKRAH